MGEKKRTIELTRKSAKDAKELVEKLEKALTETRTYSVLVIATSPENSQILVAIQVHKSNKDAVGDLAEKSEFTLDGEISGLTLVPIAPGTVRPAVAVRKGRLVSGKK